ncbi:taste receptor type 2 member 107 [Rattus norvegicus]|uniref:Taste receptor type 2 member 107 n=1 Tax=Rattus norvegicus TaxID=10116 RepID=TR107_RAT|nr:taste receptor type 2 member 107 [Rattus norvegicus]Q9JKT9.1 RecName: Full=Taste receptor type 2 member 107; Short=T2R107; AltName: Full=Taste receptor type 2 member 4; Short=T2R4 [Rattus norvegicus]AAF43915.1 candidate taste receptor T2R4 [Rattus norvegicus]|eukprot:NP_076485.1 taste receptor type 2 member 107 [Rattus norvegicus]
MLSAAEGILLCVVTSEAVLGVLGDTFIALANCMEYAKNKKLSKIGFILIGLAISRIGVVWIIILQGYMQVFFPHILTFGNITEYITYIWVFLNHLSVWFATNLNILYFLKIANFSNSVFLWLKSRVRVVFIFLSGCLLTSWLLCFPQFSKMLNNSKMYWGNTSWLQQQKNVFLINQSLTNLGIFFFIIVSLITCFLLIVFLWRHIRQMHSDGSGLRDLNTEAHVKAMRVLISFAVLFILHFVGLSIQVLCFFLPQNNLLFITGLIATCLYPCGHSIILILGNKQLKQASLKALQHLTCCETKRNLSVT